MPLSSVSSRKRSVAERVQEDWVEAAKAIKGSNIGRRIKFPGLMQLAEQAI